MKYEVRKPESENSFEHTKFRMSRMANDLYRVVMLIGVCGVLLYLMDEGNIAIFQSLLAGMFMVGGTHLTRRLLFNRLDLQEVALEAIRNQNIPAAIVFVAICMLLIAIMWLSMSLLR